MEIRNIHIAVNCNPVPQGVVTRGDYCYFASADQVQIYDIL